MSYITTTTYYCDFCQRSLGETPNRRSDPTRARFEVGNINQHDAKKSGQAVMVCDYDVPDQGHTPDSVCVHCRLAAARALVALLEKLNDE